MMYATIVVLYKWFSIALNYKLNKAFYYTLKPGTRGWTEFLSLTAYARGFRVRRVIYITMKVVIQYS